MGNQFQEFGSNPETDDLPESRPSRRLKDKFRSYRSPTQRALPPINFNHNNWDGGFNPLNGIKQGFCEAADVSWHIFKRHLLVWRPFICLGFLMGMGAFGWVAANIIKPGAAGTASAVLNRKVPANYPVAAQITNTAVLGARPVVTGVVTGTVNAVGTGLQLTAAGADAYFQTEYVGYQQPAANQNSGNSVPAAYSNSTGPKQNTALYIWNSPNVRKLTNR